MSSINRAELLKAATLVRPALATANFIPHLMHIQFAGGRATAYNDSLAISVQTPALGFDTCLPGDLLIKALNSFKGDTVAVSDDGPNATLVNGRARVKLPGLDAAKFPFEAPALAQAEELCDITSGFLRGLERCLPGVGADRTHPAQCGVTLETSGGKAVLFSTDNFTISRYTVADETHIALPGDAPVILPTEFVQAVVSIGKVFNDTRGTLYDSDGLLIASFGKKAFVASKKLVDLEALDFDAVLKALLPRGKAPKDITESVPTEFDNALERALMVTASEVDKIMKVSGSATMLKLRAASQVGDSSDEMPFESSPEDPVHVDPALVARGIKGCAFMAWLPKALLVASEDHAYIHLVSYCAAPGA